MTLYKCGGSGSGCPLRDYDQAETTYKIVNTIYPCTIKRGQVTIAGNMCCSDATELNETAIPGVKTCDP